MFSFNPFDMMSKVSEPGFAGLKDDQDGDKKRISEKGHTAKNNHYIDEHPNRTLFFIFRFFVPLFDIFVPLWYLMILAGQVG